MRSQTAPATSVRCEPVRRRLARRLRRGEIVVLDYLPAHEAPEVDFFIQQRGATVKRLSPYLHDFNLIEPSEPAC